MSIRLRNVLAFAVPLLLFGLTVLAAWTNLDRLPPDVALEWGPEGVTKTGKPLQLFSIATRLILLTFINALAATIALQKRYAMQRFWIAFAFGTSTFSLIYTIGLNAIQWDLPTGLEAPDPTPWAIGAAVGGLVVAALGWAAIGEPPTRAPGAALPTYYVHQSWSQPVRFSRKARIFIWTTIWFCSGLMFILGIGVRVPLFYALGAVILLVGWAQGTSWQLTINETEVALKPKIGARTQIPMEDVVGAGVTQTSWRQWGGTGIRSRKEGDALITRSGEALVIFMSDGRFHLVTVDNAAGPAQYINALVGSRQPGENID